MSKRVDIRLYIFVAELSVELHQFVLPDVRRLSVVFEHEFESLNKALPNDIVPLIQPQGDCLAVERLLAGGGSEPPPERAARAWQRPLARFDLLEALAGASAAIDLSDGLLADARHLCDASACSLVLDRAAITDPALTEAVGPEDAERLALSGGEDYEILATAREVLPGFRVIGEALAGRDIRWQDGSELQLSGAEGWDHGRQG